jgi:MFS transporter, ACS family, glucarate transporter
MPTGEKRSFARFGVLGFLGSLTALLYLDRLCISTASLRMSIELNIPDAQLGYVFSAFTLAYGLFEIPTGHWGDKFGSRGVLTRIVLWWSAFTALTGCVPYFQYGGDWKLPLGAWSISLPPLISSFGLLLLVRFLFGAGEAGALPNSARVVRRWFPLAERGWAQGIILSLMQVGAVVSPKLSQILINQVGWRWAFVCFGSLGIVWSALFYWWFRDDPAEHPQVNDAERRWILSHGQNAHAAGHDPIPWKSVRSTPTVWLLGYIMSALSFSSYMYMNWLPKYLHKGRGVSEDLAATLTSFAHAGGAIGALIGGYLSVKIIRLTGERLWTRRLTGAFFVAGSGLCLIGTIYCDSPQWACALFAGGAFCSQAQISTWWASVMDISGKHLGAMFGLMNSLGIPGAMTSPIFLGHFADYRKSLGYVGRDQWDPAFYLYGGVLFSGAICWLFVNSTKSAVGESSETDAELSAHEPEADQ